MTPPFRVGITADFRTDASGLLEPVLAEQFGSLPAIECELMPELLPEVTPAQIQGYDAVISLAVRFTANTLRGAERLVTIARWGVGYDMIDTQACTDNDVLLCITRDAVRRPVAEGIMTLLLALTKHVLTKDRLVRTGRWDAKTDYPGIGLRGRTLGTVGVGNIGGELARLLRPFDLRRILAYDPYVSSAQAAEIGVELVDLDTLMAESDFVSINCPLTKDLSPDRRTAAPAYAASGAADQHLARPSHRSGGTDARAASAPDRRCGAGCVRAGAAGGG